MDSDNLAGALPDFKEEDLKNFDENDFNNGENCHLISNAESLSELSLLLADPNFFPSNTGAYGGPPTSMAPMTSCAPPTQPLPSNVLGKGGDRNLDQQYMQQSSQLYVFSTQWANRSAEAVMSEQYGSIIAWHESQPETKKQLEVRLFLIKA